MGGLVRIKVNNGDKIFVAISINAVTINLYSYAIAIGTVIDIALK